jgi:diaminopimelate decarboxylase
MDKNAHIASINMQEDNYIEYESAFIEYNEETLLDNIDVLKQALHEHELDAEAEIFFAMKACYQADVLVTFSREGISFEILSEYEASILSHNFDDEFNCVVNGFGRTKGFLKKCIEANHSIVIDSLHQLGQLEELTASLALDQCVNVGVRISPPALASDSPYVTETKLGYASTDEEFTAIIQKLALLSARLKVEFIHLHSTICETNPDFFRQLFMHQKPIVKSIENELGYKVKRINIGGGFASFSRKQDAQNFFSKVFQLFKQSFPENSIMLEPGRFLCNNSAKAVGRIIDIKERAESIYIFTNVTTNALIPIPTANYYIQQIDALKNIENKKNKALYIVDSITSPHNIITVLKNEPYIPQIGDQITIGNCGAYTTNMQASWCFPLLPVRFVKKSTDALTTIHNV